MYISESAIRNTIDTIIQANNNEEITGTLLNSVLNDMVSFSYTQRQKTSEIRIDPFRGDDAKAKIDKTIPFQTPREALLYVQAGQTLRWLPGQYEYTDNSEEWSKAGVIYEFEYGAEIINKVVGGEPFNFQYDGDIIFGGYLRYYAKTGIKGSVNGGDFPFKFRPTLGNPTNRSNLIFYADEIITHKGGLTIREGIPRSYININRIGESVDNALVDYTNCTGLHTFEIQNMGLSSGNQWAGTSCISVGGLVDTSFFYLTGKIKNITISNDTTTRNQVFYSKFNAFGNQQLNHIINIEVGTVVADSTNVFATEIIHREQFAGTLVIHIGKAICKNGARLYSHNDNNNHSGLLDLTVKYLYSEIYTVGTAQLNDDSNINIDIQSWKGVGTDGNIQCLYFAANSFGEGKATVKGNWVLNDYDGIKVGTRLREFDINQLTIRLPEGNNSFSCSTGDQLGNILNYISFDKPITSFDNTNLSSLYVDMNNAQNPNNPQNLQSVINEGSSAISPTEIDISTAFSSVEDINLRADGNLLLSSRNLIDIASVGNAIISALRLTILGGLRLNASNDDIETYSGNKSFSELLDLNNFQLISESISGKTLLDTTNSIINFGGYSYDNNTVKDNPGVGFFRLNNSSVGSVTEMYISETTKNIGAYASFLERIASGDMLTIQRIKDGQTWNFNVSVAPIDEGNYQTIGLSSLGGSSLSILEDDAHYAISIKEKRQTDFENSLKTQVLTAPTFDLSGGWNAIVDVGGTTNLSFYNGKEGVNGTIKFLNTNGNNLNLSGIGLVFKSINDDMALEDYLPIVLQEGITTEQILNYKYMTDTEVIYKIKLNTSQLPGDLNPYFGLIADQGVYSDMGTTLALNDDPVQQWDDRSLNNRNFIENSLNKRPIFKSDSLNNFNGVLFDGIKSMTIAGDVNITSLSFILVFKALDVVNSRILSSIWTGSGFSNTSGFQIYLFSNTLGVQFRNSSSVQDYSIPFNDVNNYYVLTIRHNASSPGGSIINIKLDGLDQLNITNANPMVGNDNDIVMGNFNGGDTKSSNLQIWFYDRFLSDSESESIENYLLNTYSL